MRLPLIKHINGFISSHDEDFVEEAISVLEHLSQSSHIKDPELEVIGELLSNLYGALEVRQMMRQGLSEKAALNGFMERVSGLIDG